MYPQGGNWEKKKLGKKGGSCLKVPKKHRQIRGAHRVQYVEGLSGYSVAVPTALQGARTVWRILLHTVPARLLCVSPAATTILAI